MSLDADTLPYAGWGPINVCTGNLNSHKDAEWVRVAKVSSVYRKVTASLPLIQSPIVASGRVGDTSL